jgi:hypothetical protein
MSRTALAVTALCLLRASTGQRPRAPASGEPPLSLVGQSWMALLHSLASDAFATPVVAAAASSAASSVPSVSSDAGGASVSLAEQLPLFLFAFHAIDSDDERHALVRYSASKLNDVVLQLAQRGGQALQCEPAARVVALLRYVLLHSSCQPSGALLDWVRAVLANERPALAPLTAFDGDIALPASAASMALMGSAPGELVRRLAQLMTAALTSNGSACSSMLAEHCWQLVTASDLASELGALGAADRLPVLDLFALLHHMRAGDEAPTLAASLTRLFGHATILAESGQGATRLYAMLCGAASAVFDALSGRALTAALVARGAASVNELYFAVLRLLHAQRSRLVRSQAQLALANTPHANNDAYRTLVCRAIACRDSSVLDALLAALGDGAALPATAELAPLSLDGLVSPSLRGAALRETTVHAVVLHQAQAVVELSPQGIARERALVVSLLARCATLQSVRAPAPAPDDATKLLLLETAYPLAQSGDSSRVDALALYDLPQVYDVVALAEFARTALTPGAPGDAVQTRVRAALTLALLGMCRSMVLLANAPRGRVDLQWFFTVAEPTLRVDAPPLHDLLLASVARQPADAATLCARETVLCHLLFDGNGDAGADGLAQCVLAAFGRLPSASQWVHAVASNAETSNVGRRLLALLALRGGAHVRSAMVAALLPLLPTALAGRVEDFDGLLGVLRIAVASDGASLLALARVTVGLLETATSEALMDTNAARIATLVGFVGSLTLATVDGASDMDTDVAETLPSSSTTAAAGGTASATKRALSGSVRLRRSASMLMQGAEMMFSGVEDEDDEDDDDDDNKVGGDKRAASDAASPSVPPGRSLGDANKSNLCTFTSTGSNFEKQHWYHCYTCGLTNSEGCCSVCIRRCHAGHVVSYSRFSRFFCDCGAGAMKGRSCQSLVPPSASGGDGAADGGDGGACVAGSADADLEADKAAPCPTPTALLGVAEVGDARNALRGLLLGDGAGARGCEEALVGTLTRVLTRLHVRLMRALEVYSGAGATTSGGGDAQRSTGNATGLLRGGRRTTTGVTNNVKWSAAAEVTRKLSAAHREGSAWRSALSATPGGDLMAVAETDCISLVSVSDLLQNTAAAAASSVAALGKSALTARGKCSTAYQAIGVEFNPVSPLLLLSWGASDCEVITLDERGEPIDRLAVQLALDDAEADHCIIKAFWLPQSPVCVVVVLPTMVKLFDLSRDAIAPIACFGVVDAAIVDATVVCTPSGAPSALVVMTRSGVLLTSDIDVARAHEGVYYLYAVLLMPNSVNVRSRSGLAVHWNDAGRVLLASWQSPSSQVLVELRVSADCSAIESAFVVGSANVRRLPTLNWINAPALAGVVVGRATSGEALALSLQSDGAHVQQLAQPCSGRVIGLAPISLPAEGGGHNEACAIVLFDVGVLHFVRISATPSSEPADGAPPTTPAQQPASAATSSAVSADDQAAQLVRMSSAACAGPRRFYSELQVMRASRAHLSDRFDAVRREATLRIERRAGGEAGGESSIDAAAKEIAGDQEPLTSEGVNIVAASRNWFELFYTSAERADLSRAGIDANGFAALASSTASGAGKTPGATPATSSAPVQPPPMPRKGDLAAVVRDRLQMLESLLNTRLRRSTTQTPPSPSSTPASSSSSVAAGAAAAAPPAAAAASSAGAAASDPTFPVDFFEHVDNVTPNVTFGGDLSGAYASSEIHALLQQRGSALCGPPGPFVLRVMHRASNSVIAGIRLLVGHLDPATVPARVVVVGRTIEIQHGVRRWYDIPLTASESKQVGRELPITILPPTGGEGQCAQIDGLEVYASSTKAPRSGETSEDAAASASLATAAADALKRDQAAAAARAALQLSAANKTVELRSLALVTAAATRAIALASLSDNARQQLRAVVTASLSDALPMAACAPVRVQLRQLLATVIPQRSQLQATLSEGGVAALVGALRREVDPASVVATATSGIAPIQSYGSPLKALLSRLRQLLLQGDAEQIAAVWRAEPDLSALLARAFDIVSAGVAGGDRARSNVDLLASLLNVLFTHARYADSAETAATLSAPYLLAPSETIRCAASAVICSLFPVASPSAAAAATSASAAANPAADAQFACDGCKAFIGGVRFHCDVCSNFDLCATCQAAAFVNEAHTASHAITRIDAAAPPQQQPPPSASDSVGDLAARFVEHLVGLMDRVLSRGGMAALPYFQTLHVLVLQHHAAPAMRALLPRIIDVLLPVVAPGSTALYTSFDAGLSRSSALEVRTLCVKMLAAFTALPRGPPAAASAAAADGKTPVAASSKAAAAAAASTKRAPLASTPALADAVLQTLASQRVPVRLQALLERVAQLLEARVGELDGVGEPVDDGAHAGGAASSGGSGAAASSAASAAVASAAASAASGKSGAGAAGGDGAVVSSGALLKVRSGDARRSYLPFFNEAFVKEHASDLFADRLELLGEAALKLALEFFRPSRPQLRDATADSARRALWRVMLCRFVYAPRGAGFGAGVKYGKKVLLALSEDRAAYYLARDSFVFERALTRVWAIRDACGGAYGNLAYTRRVSLVRLLSQLVDAAFQRPRNWCLFSAQQPQHVVELLKATYRLTREAALPSLRLVLLLLRTASAPAQAGDAGLQTHVRALVGDLLSRERALLAFVKLILLGGGSADVRSTARNLLHAAWQLTDDAGRAALLRALIRVAPTFAQFGLHAHDAQLLFAYAIRERGGACDAAEQEAMCSAVLDTLRAVNERVACHPNAALYRSLANVLEFDGYYLESEPCSVCSDPETPFSVVPLTKLAVESKYTSTTHVVRLRRCVEVRQVSVAITLPGSRGSRLVKSIGVYYSAAEVADVGELTGNWSRWTLACRLKVAPSATTAEFTLPIAVALNNMLFEFNEFYDTAAAREKLMCPRCNRAVTNKHGTCDSCRENAYQCRQCRNINYEHLDAFLCNECGFCKHAKFGFSIDQRPTIVAPRVESEDERVAALAVIDRESVKAHEQYERIRAQHGPLAKLASTLSERDEHVRIVGAEQLIAQLPALASVSKKVFALAVLYGKECQQSFEALSQSTRVLLSTRRELLRYARAAERADTAAGSSAAQSAAAGAASAAGVAMATDADDLDDLLLDNNADASSSGGGGDAEPHGGCFGCSMTYLTQCLLPLQQLALDEATRRRLVAGGAIQELVSNNVRDGPLATRTLARRAVCLFTRGDIAAATLLGDLLRTAITPLVEQPRISTAEDLRALVQLLVTSGMYADESTWQHRFQVVADVFFHALGANSSRRAEDGSLPPVVDANLARHVLVPCLRLIIARCTPPSASSIAASAASTAASTEPVAAAASVAAAWADSESSVPSSPAGASSTTTLPTLSAASSRSSGLRRLREAFLPTVTRAPPAEASGTADASGSSNGGAPAAAAAAAAAAPIDVSVVRAKSDADDDDPSTITASYRAWRAGSLSFDDWLGGGSSADNASDATPAAARMAVDDGESGVTRLLTARQRGIVRRCVQRWRARRGKASSNELAMGGGGAMRVLDKLAVRTWLQPLFVASCSRTLRAATAQLVTVLCGDSEARALRFAEMCADLLVALPTSGPSGTELLELFAKLSEPETRRLYLAARGFVPRLMQLIARHVERMSARERAGVAASVGDGSTLRPLVKSLTSFVAIPVVRERLKRSNALPLVLDSYLSLRGLVLQKTKLTDDAAGELRELLAALSEGEPQAFLAACVAALGRPGADQRTMSFVLEQMCSVICPSKAEPDYALVLRKAPTQEEFIRGHMTKNPYSTAEVGPLMRDVKNKICRTLDLSGFLDDDNGMELLVRNKIVKLHLPVARVYRAIWRPADGAEGDQQQQQQQQQQLLMQQQGELWRRRAGASEEPSSVDPNALPPMTIVYRLAGLDGEATEDIVDELADARDEQLDPEIEFAPANRMAENGGLAQLLVVMSELRDLSRERELATVLFRLLGACAKLRVNRRALVRLGAIDVALRQLRLAFAAESDAHVAAALALLPIVEAVIGEANRMERFQSSNNLGRSASIADALAAEGEEEEDAPQPMATDDERAQQDVMNSSSGGAGATSTVSSRIADRIEQMRTMLERLSSPFVRNNKPIVTSVTRVLPFLTYGQRAVIDVLVEHFEEHVAPDALDETPPPATASDSSGEPSVAERRALLFDACALVLTAAPGTSRVGVRLRDAFLARGVTAHVLAYLATAVEARAAGERAWLAALARPAMPYALALLAALTDGHAPTQRLVVAVPDLLPSLHRMEQTATQVARVGALAENVLESMKTADVEAARGVDQIRAASQRDKKRLAQQHRRAVLRNMGIAVTDGRSTMHVGGTGDALAAQAPDDDEFPCMVCREGYSFKPEEVICVYTFSVPVSVARSARHREFGYETVSHFNAIHGSCHREAVRADRSMRQPKKEWEGATLRNQQTKCNNLFPVRGAQTTDADYSRAVDVFWANQAKVGQSSVTRQRLLVHDLRSLLMRFAAQRSFADAAGGGGRESNLLFLPHWLQMGICVIDASGGAGTRAALETQLHGVVARTHRLTQALAPTQTLAEQVAALQLGGMPTRAELLTESDDACYMVALSLLVLSPEQWRAVRFTLLTRTLLEAILAAATATSSTRGQAAAAAASSSSGAASASVALAAAAGASAAAQPLSGASLTDVAYAHVASESFDENASASARRFRVCRDSFVLIAFVDKLQRIVKPAAAEQSDEAPGALSSQAGTAAWVLHMKKMILPGETLRGLCRRVLSEYEDELCAFEEAQEFCDDMGLLQSVLAKYPSADAYVEDMFAVAAATMSSTSAGSAAAQQQQQQQQQQ